MAAQPLEGMLFGSSSAIRLASITRSRESIISLVKSAGWRLDAELETPLTYIVRLREA